MSGERPELLTLAETLLEKTKKSNLRWVESILRDRFLVQLKNGSVQIVHYTRDMGEHAPEREVYTLVVRDDRERVVDQLEFDYLDEGDTKALVLKNLFEVARSSARGAKDVIKGMIFEVQGVDSSRISEASLSGSQPAASN
jgi:hypothetical protein